MRHDPIVHGQIPQGPLQQPASTVQAGPHGADRAVEHRRDVLIRQVIHEVQGRDGTVLFREGPQGAYGDLAQILTPQEIRAQAEMLLSKRQIEKGRYVTREQFLDSLNGP